MFIVHVEHLEFSLCYRGLQSIPVVRNILVVSAGTFVIQASLSWIRGIWTFITTFLWDTLSRSRWSRKTSFTCFWSRYSASSFSSVTVLLGSAAIPAIILSLIVIMALATMILVILMIVITTSTLQRNKDLVTEPLSRRLAESWEAETSRWFQVVAWWRVRRLWFAFIFVIVLAICTVICSW